MSCPLCAQVTGRPCGDRAVREAGEQQRREILPVWRGVAVWVQNCSRKGQRQDVTKSHHESLLHQLSLRWNLHVLLT